MTPTQVSELSDTELNRAMIWLYPPNWLRFNPHKDAYITRARLAHRWDLNYLADYNLTMPLAVENDLFTESLHSMNLKGLAGTMAGDTTAHCTTLLRAICEVLVLIALDKAQN